MGDQVALNIYSGALWIGFGLTDCYEFVNVNVNAQRSEDWSSTHLSSIGYLWVPLLMKIVLSSTAMQMAHSCMSYHCHSQQACVLNKNTLKSL